MKITEVKEQIVEGISKSFQKHDFKYKKQSEDFIRQINNTSQIFRLNFYRENNGTITIKPEIIIHINDIETIYKSIAYIKDRPYLTLGNYFSEIRDYDGNALNYKKKPIKYWLIEDGEDIEHLIKIIPEYLVEDILPYFESNSSIKRVDELLNEFPEKMCVHNYIYPLRANIAIIAAKLNKNPQYDELIETYEKELVDAEENYKKEFYEIIDVLKNI